MAPTKSHNLVRKIYLYLVSIISIVVFVIAAVGLINIVLSEYVFEVKSYQEMEDYWECTNYTVYETDYTWKCDDPYYLGEEVSYSEISPETQRAQCLETAKSEFEAAKKTNDEEFDKCKADTDVKRTTQHLNDVKRDFVMYFSMLIVAFPLFLFHWRLIKKEEGK